MPTIEERVAFLEGRVTEHTRGIDGLREAMASLEARMDRRFEGVDRRFESLEQRLHAFEDRVGRRFDDLDAKISRHFVWLVGIVVTAMAAMLAAVIGKA